MKKNALILISIALFFLKATLVMAQINWPQGQLLPSFPEPAQTQDLIYINGSSAIEEKSWKWEAEGNQISHGTGRHETDGWLCQVGIDEANKHMVYGPYFTGVIAGNNIAQFRMKIDNNTINDEAVVEIDVRNASTGNILASKVITRKQFTVAGEYTTINLPFLMPANNQSVELRIYWRGTAYTKVDWIGVKQNNKIAEKYLFASLKGVVNKTQPRIFSYEGDAFAEGPYTWLQSLKLDYIEYLDRWQLVSKYIDEIDGLIIYDPAQIHTVNLATSLAHRYNALIAAPALIEKLTSAPYNLPISLDLRDKYPNKLSVYQDLFNNYWPSMDQRLLIGLGPALHQASLREYASALGSAVIWLDPDIPAESTLLNQFLNSMPQGANYMGWWPEEAPGIIRASTFGIPTIASDYATNLTMHSGMSREINVKPIPPKPQLQNKIYVAFILSDGDNLQYVEHLMRKLWNNPDRGSVPLGWTISPAMVDAMPGALNFYHQTATNNDNLISGPSGYGYIYPNDYPNQATLNEFVKKTEEYNKKAGIRVLTIWNTITGGINQSSGESFANFAPTLLGVTGQNTGGPLSIYNHTLPGKPLSCNYCTNQQAMKDHIASAANGWNGNEPRFIIIQAQPWTDVKPSDFKSVANSLGADYVVVRPDHLFQLMRESEGLTINPGGNVNANVFIYNDCNYEGFSAGLDLGNYNAQQLKNIGFNINTISSLKILDGYKVTLYSEDNFTGNSISLTANDVCLVNKGFNDITKSLKVESNFNIGNGNGLTANYFNGQNFEDHILNRVDETVDFNWGEGSPHPMINNDNFSARWTGKIEPKVSGEHTFYIKSDNGRRLWINNQLIIDKWIDDWGTEYSGKINLQRGEKYNIRLDYFENFGGAENHLSWSTKVLPKEIVPKSQLYSNNLPSVSFITPLNNSTIKSNNGVDIEILASDSDGTISKIELFENGNLIKSFTSKPYFFNMDASEGEYNIIARAYDNLEAVNVANINFAVGNTTLNKDIYNQNIIISHDRNYIIIDSKGIKLDRYTLYNIYGQNILDKQCNTDYLTIDISHVNTGVYFLNIELNNKELIMEKIIIK